MPKNPILVIRENNPQKINQLLDEAFEAGFINVGNSWCLEDHLTMVLINPVLSREINKYVEELKALDGPTNPPGPSLVDDIPTPPTSETEIFDEELTFVIVSPGEPDSVPINMGNPPRGHAHSMMIHLQTEGHNGLSDIQAMLGDGRVVDLPGVAQHSFKAPLTTVAVRGRLVGDTEYLEWTSVGSPPT